MTPPVPPPATTGESARWICQAITRSIADRARKIRMPVLKIAKEPISMETVLRMRFGIDMNTDHTLEEVAKQFDVTRERIPMPD